MLGGERAVAAAVAKRGAPKVSVMVPAYNAARFIVNCLRSALDQADVDLEIVLVDDASVDGTLALAERMADPRVRILRNPVNRGEFFSRNRVIDEARGEWIAILDADDSWVPGRLRRLLDLAEEAGADLVGDNLIIHVTESGRSYEAFDRRLLAGVRWLTPEVFIGTAGPDGRASFGHMQPVIRTAFLRSNGIRYPEIGAIAGDFTFCLECLLKNARYLVDPTPGYVYNIHSASVSNDRTRRAWLGLAPHARHVLALAEGLGRTDLIPALQRREAQFRRYIAYREFADPLKQGRVGHALGALLKWPAITGDVLHYLSLAVRRRASGQTGPMQRRCTRRERWVARSP